MADAAMPPATYSRLNPFPAPLIENRLLSKLGSGKEVRHISLDLAGSGLTYRVGQSLGVQPINDPAEVAELLAAGGWSPDAPVMLPKATAAVGLAQALAYDLSLGGPTRKALELLASVAMGAEKEKLQAHLDPAAAEALKGYLEGRFFVDLALEYPQAMRAVTPQQLVDVMRKLQPRLYSIASSPKVAGSRVDLTVAVVRYTSYGRARNGVCSSYLADRVAIGQTAKVFVAESPFALTEDDNAPIIMIGPGTGIAPFRAFLHERQARGAKGKNWLFFGDRHRATDYLYEEEWAACPMADLLTHISLAWSRDGASKVYVQDLMRQESIQLWAWLQAGGYVYVCGDAKRMAKDVEAALLQIIATHGRIEHTQAGEYLMELKAAKRYMRDVY